MSLESFPIVVQMLVLLACAVPAALAAGWALMWVVDRVAAKIGPHE